MMQNTEVSNHSSNKEDYRSKAWSHWMPSPL